MGSSSTGGAEFSSSSFLYPFLSTSLHSALSGVESGARCTITEGPCPVMINQCLSTYNVRTLQSCHSVSPSHQLTCMLMTQRYNASDKKAIVAAKRVTDDLSTIHSWCRDYHLLINQTKTLAMFLSRNKTYQAAN